jgi:hypothetical protein
MFVEEGGEWEHLGDDLAMTLKKALGETLLN